ncbi:integrase, catalytic region, zinc finger, CCHC-type containing protein [Tanacetum coccineum]|uniref:Integrase, catalytic region, zinc finger, CCHC-type containing protein n=1 Tax=Tanacetum coccineum TaxID=301880 RepID=A0ABQ5I0H0_9ASTR
MEGIGHNLFSVGQFCDSDLEVAFRKHMYFVLNLEGVDLLSGSRETNLYTLSIRDMMTSSPICLLSKALKTKSCKKQSHKPKSEDTNQEKLYLLHMDLCGPMRVARINGEKYILVIMDDYSQFIWVKFLASKDEAPDFIINFLKMIQDLGFNPATSSSGLVSNPILQQPCNPPPRDDWDRLFQPMFNEYFNPPIIDVSPVPVVAAPRVVDLADSLVLKNHQKQPIFSDDPLHESLYEDSTSQGSSNVRPIHTPFKSLGRWTKDYPIANVIEDPSHSVSTRKQLQTDAMWCYFGCLPTSIELKNSTSNDQTSMDRCNARRNS